MASPLALLSVTDKTGLVDFARGLVGLGFQIISTGGTARLLQEADVPVTDVAQYTGSPEILDGRVKTLHPKVHGGILFDRSKASHQEQVDAAGIRPIDLVVVNLYQFENQALKRRLELAEAIEYIDIGGPCMLRAAAKNFLHCTPIIDPQDYPRCLSELQGGGLSPAWRRQLAGKTFRAISRYDSMIAGAFEGATETEDLAPQLSLDLQMIQPLRYGENPHQKAAFYRSPFSLPGGLQDARVLQGKELSFNNLLDCDAAAQIVADFPEHRACTIIKHTNPCGTALAQGSESLLSVYQRALAVDPKSAFGGIVAFNQAVDAETAEALSQLFLECIVAPSYSPEALTILGSKKNLRVLALPYLALEGKATEDRQYDLRSVLGGVLLQERDAARCSAETWRVVTQRQPTPAERDDLVFAMRLCKHVKSNAIVYAKDLSSVAVGAGQMSRIDSAQFAAGKAAEFGRSIVGTVMASDAFFPFRDTVELAAERGVRAIIQPGGSLRDQESIDAANTHGIAMVFTGIRHFKH